MTLFLALGGYSEKIKEKLFAIASKKEKEQYIYRQSNLEKEQSTDAKNEAKTIESDK